MKRGRGRGSQPAFVLARNGIARFLNLSGSEQGSLDLRDGDHEPYPRARVPRSAENRRHFLGEQP